MSDMSLMAIIHWCARQRIKNVVAKNVLNALSTYADRAGIARPSQRKLAEHTGYSERAVRMALALLEAEGFIHRIERRRANGSQTSDELRIALDRDAHHRQDVPAGRPAAADAGGTSCRTRRNLVPVQAAPDSAPTSFDQPGEQSKDSSEADASGPGGPVPGKKILFSEGRSILVSLAIDRKTAGDVIARWLRDADGDAPRVLGAIRSAREHDALAPIPWITAHLRQPRTDHARFDRQPALARALDGLADRLRLMDEL